VRTCAADFGSLVGAFHDAFSFPSFMELGFSVAWVAGKLVSSLARLQPGVFPACLANPQTHARARLVSGKPTITPKTPFSVNDLDRKPCTCKGIGKATETVDNLLRAGSSTYNSAAPKRTFPQ